MMDLKGRILQTIIFIVMLTTEIVAVFFVDKGILRGSSKICVYMVNTSMLFMVIVQLLWLQGLDKVAAVLCHIYFIIMCVMLYYAKTALDIAVFGVNLGCLLNVIVVRAKKGDRAMKNIQGENGEEKEQEENDK